MLWLQAHGWVGLQADEVGTAAGKAYAGVQLYKACTIVQAVPSTAMRVDLPCWWLLNPGLLLQDSVGQCTPDWYNPRTVDLPSKVTPG
jgi:hypothetical protein